MFKSSWCWVGTEWHTGLGQSSQADFADRGQSRWWVRDVWGACGTAERVGNQNWGKVVGVLNVLWEWEEKEGLKLPCDNFFGEVLFCFALVCLFSYIAFFHSMASQKLATPPWYWRAPKVNLTWNCLNIWVHLFIFFKWKKSDKQHKGCSGAFNNTIQFSPARKDIPFCWLQVHFPIACLIANLVVSKESR